MKKYSLRKYGISHKQKAAYLNPFPNDKIFNNTTLKRFADTGFCPGRALAPFAQKNSRWRKKIQLDGPEGAPNFSNQKTTKSDFRDVVLVF